MTIYEQIQCAIEFIESNLSENIKCAETAAESNMSERSFNNYFNCVTGFSFKQYLMKRRLSRSLELLCDDRFQVVDVALESGYETHESFTRAFRKEFGIAPVEIKNNPAKKTGIKTTEKLQLIKEMYMGVIVKKLPQMKALAFSALAPQSEDKALGAMNEWLNSKNLGDTPRRIFGHNIDRNGNISHDPENEGYKVFLCLDKFDEIDTSGARIEIIPAGTFIATGIEGSFEEDPSCRFIVEGWQRMNKMAEEKNYKIKQPARWFEEQLEASKPGNMRLDLYIEIAAGEA